MQLGMYPDELWDKIRPQAKIRHNWDVSGNQGIAL